MRWMSFPGGLDNLGTNEETSKDDKEMLVTDLRTGIVSCNGKSWKLSPGQHQMLEWVYEDELPTKERDGYFLWMINTSPWRSYTDYLNWLGELIFKGMEGEV